MDPRDHLALKDPLDCKDPPDLLVLQVRRDPEVSKDLWDQRVLRDHVVWSDLPV